MKYLLIGFLFLLAVIVIALAIIIGVALGIIIANELINKGKKKNG